MIRYSKSSFVTSGNFAIKFLLVATITGYGGKGVVPLARSFTIESGGLVSNYRCDNRL